MSPLKLSNDRKVSPLQRYETGAKRWKPLVPNAFGLLSGPAASCPGATPFCTSCYACKLETGFPSVGRLVKGNLEALQECGSNVDAMVELISAMIAQYLTTLNRAQRRALKKVPNVFRIHWDGDFFSWQYAAAWAVVIRANPQIQFWAYTRSFAFVGALAGLTNLSLYLSVDEYNAAEAAETLAEHPWVRLAFCAQDWDAGEVLAQKLTGRNAPKCPEGWKVPLVNDAGEGACVTCGLCLYGRNNVRFAVSA